MAEGLRGKSELTQRVISGAVMAALGVFVAWWGGWPFALVWAGLAAAVAYEWGRIVTPERALLMAGLIALCGAVLILGMVTGLRLPVTFVAALCLLVVAAMAPADRRLWLTTGAAYAFLLMWCTVLLRGAGHIGFVAILFMFAVVWMTDIGAYFTGRTFGGPKFAPAISPKKTWSGVVGGLASGVIAGCGVVLAAGLPLRPAHAAIAALLGVAVVFGDLFESFLKRRFGVKDAGALIPGHGGVLDRLDGFALAVVLAAMIGAARGGWANAAAGLLAW